MSDTRMHHIINIVLGLVFKVPRRISHQLSQLIDINLAHKYVYVNTYSNKKQINTSAQNCL